MSSVLTATWKMPPTTDNLTKSIFLQVALLPEIHLCTCFPQTALFPLLFLLNCICEPVLHVSGRVCGGEVLHTYSDQFLSRNWLQEELVSEHLPAGLAEIF